ncbi:hypothetical protein HY837_04490 [archaeon]|nr:hypothetical protein [archaeon]
MKATIVLDDSAQKELKELSSYDAISKSKLIRRAIKELYLKEMRARKNLLFFVDLYNEGTINKDILFLLLPKKDAESVIIGSKTGREALNFAKDLDY